MGLSADPRFKPLPLESIALLGEGKLVEAIKSVRMAEGLSHKEARRRVDAHLDQDPILRVQIETQRIAARRKFFFWFLIVDVLITAGIIYWFFYRGPG
jgi:hypothetical protein